MEQLQEQLRDLKVQLETKINYYEDKIELMRKNFERERKDSEENFKAEIHKMEDQKRDLEETVASYWAVIDSLKKQKCVWSLELEERFEMEQARMGQQHAKDIYHPGQQLDQEGEELRMQCRNRESLRKHVSEFGREKVEELAEIAELAVLSENSKEEVSHLDKMHQLSHELTEHAACWMETELLRQQLKASQEKEEHEHLLQAAVEQAEGLENNLRSAEAVLAERAAQLKDAQAQLSRNKLLIKDLREENRGFAMALQAAELKQKSTEEKNQLLKEQASALKQLIRKITPASLTPLGL